ncbi:MAG TPA: methyltransferase domain-containing protein [Thermoplasmata archaeon]|nr:methyltransferase domain-containing protein [Thermoplasmata archaeon]
METEYRPSTRDRLRVRVRRALLERIRVLLAPEGLRLLDLGGGTGAATVVFGARARERVVLEPDEQRISRGRAAHTPVTFVSGVAETVPFDDGRFDRIVSLMSFHHFSEGDTALREAVRVLAPGGRFVLYDFDPATPSGRWVAFFEGRVLRHSFAFAAPADLERRALAAGFRAARRESFGAGAFVIAER